jgi:hypothetical protein
MFARILITALAGLVLWAIVARSSSGAGHETVYVVRPADTLWTIASSHYGGDPREAIWKLERRNGLHGTTLVPGERLLLP